MLNKTLFSNKKIPNEALLKTITGKTKNIVGTVPIHLTS